MDENSLEQADEIDWGKVWTDFGDRIYMYIYRRTSDECLSEDLTSQTFMRAIEATRNGNGWQSSFSGWLYRIARNLIIDYYRARERQASSSLDEMPHLVDRRPAPFDVVISSEIRSALESGLDRLTPEQATVLAMRFEGYSFAEIGKHLNKTEGAAKALQHRGISMLRYHLEKWRESYEIKAEQRSTLATIL